MADINAVDLTAETLNTLDGTENIVAFDTAEGKKIPLSVLGDYVVTKLTETLLGQTQTVQDALSFLKNRSEVISGIMYGDIASNDDLNDYTTNGVYSSKQNAVTRTLSNIPTGLEQAFRLVVRDNTYNSSESQNSRYKMQILTTILRRIYIRTFTTSNAGSTWTFSEWERIPTQLEVDNVTNKVAGITGIVSSGLSLTASTTQQYTIPDSSQHLIITNGANDTMHGMFLVSANSSGVVQLSQIYAGSNVTVTAPSANTLQIVNAYTATCYVKDICLNGTAISKITTS